MKKLIALLLVLFSLVLLCAENFTIEEYSIEIIAKENGTLHITENLSVNFLEESHGIYRDIQTSFSNPNGNAFDPIKAKVENVKATKLYKSEKEDEGLRLILGDPNSFAPKKESYEIEYDYSLDYNRTVGYDELYYNIISPSWDVPIENIKWSITLPSTVKQNRIWVTEGQEGGTREGSFSLNSNGTIIKGEKDFLLPHGAITIRVEMDKGYWKNWYEKEDNSFLYSSLSIGLASLFLIIVILSWFKWGRDEKIGEIEERNLPPEGMSPLEAGYIVDEEISAEKEGLATIFYWAEKGYISIKEEGKDNYRFTKLKELPLESKESEKKLLSLFFSSPSVDIPELAKNNFSLEFLSKVVKEVRKETKDLKSKESGIAENVFVALTLVISIASGVLLSSRYLGLLSLFISLLFFFPIFISLIIFSSFASMGRVMKESTKKVLWIIIGTQIFIPLILLSLLGVEAQLSFYNFGAIFLSFALMYVSGIFSSLMGKRSEKGNKKLVEVLGYRKHIKALLDGEKKPTEEDIKAWGVHMAFAFAFKLKENKNLEDGINYPQPSWYTGTWNGNLLMYYVLFSSCSTSYSHTYSTIASTSPGGGGFSSSGFAGGGFSGGGGGSW